MNCYAVELWVRGIHYDTYDWFEVRYDDEGGKFAFECAQEDAEYRDQEWWDESFGYDDESLMGFTDWEIKIMKQGDF